MAIGVARGEVEVSKSGAVPVETVKAQLTDLIKAKLQDAMGQASAEKAEPQDYWDIFAYGPVEPAATTVPPAGLTDSPLLPHAIIRAGDTAYVASVIILNPLGPSLPTSADMLSSFSLPYRVEFQTGNLSKWQAADAKFQGVIDNHFVPTQWVYVDVFAFTPDAADEGLYEMNITGRVMGCNGDLAPSFSAFATHIYDFDADWLADFLGLESGTGWQKAPIRFQVYK